MTPPTPPAPTDTRGPWATLAVVVAATTLSLLPGFLIGTLSVTIRQEFGFGETRLGLLILIYMGISAATSAPLGRVVERAGALQGLRLSLLAVAVCCFGIALTARSWWHLAVWLLFAGVGSAGVYPATNLAVVRRVVFSRQGVTFGIKQASIPAATFLAGLAVPFVDVVAGWRASFGIVGGLILIVVGVSGRAIGRVHGGARRSVRTKLAMRPLLVLAFGVALAVGGVQPIAVFVVPYAVDLGLSASAAGAALAVASICGIVMRVLAGAGADRWPHRDLFSTVAVYLVLGAGAMLLLASARTMAVLSVALIGGIAIGWSWNGLFHFAVVRSNPDAPAAASGITQAGLLAGVAVGPLAFGAVAEHLSFPLGWIGCAAAMAVGCGLLLTGGRMLHAQR